LFGFDICVFKKCGDVHGAYELIDLIKSATQPQKRTIRLLWEQPDGGEPHFDALEIASADNTLPNLTVPDHITTHNKRKRLLSLGETHYEMERETALNDARMEVRQLVRKEKWTMVRHRDEKNGTPRKTGRLKRIRPLQIPAG
jgi:hypothetical protein